MNAMIFAAGIGSRLKPWTEYHPKALVEVGGQPMLERVIRRVIDAGITDIVVNVHHFGQQIIDWLKCNPFDARIAVSDERSLLLDTGGGLRKAYGLLGDGPVLVHNADILSDFPISEMIKAHQASAADVTLLTDPRTTVRRFVFSHDHRLIGWTNSSTGEVRPANCKPGPDTLLRAFDGVHILSASALEAIYRFGKDDEPFSITDFYIKQCRNLDIRGFDIPAGACWFDVGKPETLEKARRYFG